MVDCKFVSFNNASAVPVLHYVPLLSVGDVHGRGSAEESSDVFKSCKAYIFTADERVFEQFLCCDALVAVHL